MGAYIFSAEPPFEITAISLVPIAHDSMYSGQWIYYPGAPFLMDYVVFPTGFVLPLPGEDDVFLFYGHQDKQGWVLKMSLSGLLNGLERVDRHACALEVLKSVL